MNQEANPEKVKPYEDTETYQLSLDTGTYQLSFAFFYGQEDAAMACIILIILIPVLSC